MIFLSNHYTLEYQKAVGYVLNKSSLNFHITILIHFYIKVGIAVIFDFLNSEQDTSIVQSHTVKLGWIGCAI